MAHYKAIKIGGKKQDYHRYLMERHLRRKLGRNEVVHHKDGNKHNNRIENLEVMSSKAHKRFHAAKLTPRQVREIKQQLSNGVSQCGLAADYRVSKKTIYDIRHGHTWADI